MSELLPVLSLNADAPDDAVALRLAALGLGGSAPLPLAAPSVDESASPPLEALPSEDDVAIRLAALESAPRAVPPPIAPSDSPRIGSFVARATWTVSHTELGWRVPDAPLATLVEVNGSVAPAPPAPAPQVAVAGAVEVRHALPEHAGPRATRGRRLARFVAAAIVVIATLAAPSPDETPKQDDLSVVPVDAPLAPASFAVPPLESYRAEFVSESPFPTVRAGGEVEWIIALRNTGYAGWYRGVDGAQASLMVLDGTVAAVQTTPFVGPGQLGWFVTRFKAPATPSTHTVRFVPNIDGRGSLPDLGIYTVVTVTR